MYYLFILTNMKKFVFIFILMCNSFVIAQSLLTSNVNTSSSSAASISTTLNLTAGNSAIVFCKSGGSDNPTFTVTDNTAGSLNTYTGIGRQQEGTAIGYTEFFYITNIVTGGTPATVSCNFSPNEAFISIIAEQWTPFFTIDASLTGSAVAGVFPQTLTTSTYSTTHANELIFLCTAVSISTTFVVGAFDVVTAGNLVSNTGVACETGILTSTQTTKTATISCTSSNGGRTWSYGVASFQYTPAVILHPNAQVIQE